MGAVPVSISSGVSVRSGYDIDIIPTDLATYGEEAKNLLQDLQSRNERMFLVTVLVENIAPKASKVCPVQKSVQFAPLGKYTSVFPIFFKSFK